MHIVQRAQLGAQMDIASTPIVKGNRMKYSLQTSLTRLRISIPLQVGDGYLIDIRIAIWNYRGIARTSFHQNYNSPTLNHIYLFN